MFGYRSKLQMPGLDHRGYLANFWYSQ